MAEEKPKLILRTVKVGERGQIVIPKDIRDFFDIESGETLIITGHKDKITIMKEEIMREMSLQILEKLEENENE
ncbi:AbrB/MazE/SpoVT family DNA-binding domain-containing protein [Methanobacterium oryzae]|uniref:AbrB/MazE/SpoVT family DNA-binding domain-containing protein n=1 Tax=Methanobacterium oryzae TaxID=69540 RepID=UPI003D2442F3